MSHRGDCISRGFALRGEQQASLQLFVAQRRQTGDVLYGEHLTLWQCRFPCELYVIVK